MKKSLPATLIIIAIIMAGIFAYSKSSEQTIMGGDMTDEMGGVMKNDESMMTDDSTTKNNSMMEDDTRDEMEEIMSNHGQYLDYSSTEFDKYKNKKRIYFFFAPWCPTCVPTDKEISENEDRIPENTVIFKTDYDSSTELKNRYTITYQHTFVQVDENGNEIAKWNGGGINTIIENVK